MKLVQSFVTNNPYYKANVNPTDSRYKNYQKNGPKGAMLHSVGCPQPKASVFVNAWNKASYDAACIHGFIDANDGTFYQTMPWNFRAPHAGGAANNTHIGIEMCEPDFIKYTGGSSFTCSNKARAKEMAKRTYDAAVELFAMLCKEHGWDPLADGVIISHKEGHSRGIASGHGDPEHLWKGLGMSYTMNTFRRDVKAAMTGTTEPAKPAAPESTGVLYRVQVGAFSVLKYAEDMLAKVKAAGFDAIMVKVDGLYKIQVGAFSVMSNADNMMAKLEAAGFDAFVTTKSGQVVSVPAAKKSVDELAREVIQGKWGTGADRKQRLEAAGYDYNAVQARVNQLL
jgi:hypothetical protein